MRWWNGGADEQWDIVALALAFTTALAFAASLVLVFNASARRPAGRDPGAAAGVVAENVRVPRDTREP